MNEATMTQTLAESSTCTLRSSPLQARLPLATHTVLGIPFGVLDYATAIEWLHHAADEARRNRSGKYVCAANVADVMSGHYDPDFHAALAGADLNVPDGAPVVWAMRLAGHPIRKRVYGPTFMEQALETPAVAAGRHLLIAGTPSARDGVRRRFPNVNWVGEQDFWFDKLDDMAYADLATEYNDLAPDFAWVSLGDGKQIRFMHRFAPLAESGVLLGVGAAFDFHAGATRQAPAWVQDAGFEWLFRLVIEPRRLWRRYLLHNPPFLYHWAREVAWPGNLKSKP